MFVCCSWTCGGAPLPRLPLGLDLDLGWWVALFVRADGTATTIVHTTVNQVIMGIAPASSAVAPVVSSSEFWQAPQGTTRTPRPVIGGLGTRLCGKGILAVQCSAVLCCAVQSCAFRNFCMPWPRLHVMSPRHTYSSRYSCPGHAADRYRQAAEQPVGKHPRSGAGQQAQAGATTCKYVPIPQ